MSGRIEARYHPFFAPTPLWTYALEYHGNADRSDLGDRGANWMKRCGTVRATDGEPPSELVEWHKMSGI